MLTQQQLENKSMIAAEVAETIKTPDVETLRGQLAQLRADESRHEKQLHAGQGDLAAAENGISDAIFAASKGNETGAALTSWMFAQAAAQERILGAVEALRNTRVLLREAADALAHAEAHQAATEAAAFESEVIAELRIFAPAMVAYLDICQKIQALRERAQKFNRHLLTPGVTDALYPNWGEVFNADVVESRLALVAKITELPPLAAEYVYPRLRDKARAFKAEQEIAQLRVREHAELKKSGGKPLIQDEFQMEYVEGRGLVVTRDAAWDRRR